MAGAQERTRTSTAINHWYLKPARLPIPPPGPWRAHIGGELSPCQRFGRAGYRTAAAAARPLYTPGSIRYAATLAKASALRGAPGMATRSDHPGKRRAAHHDLRRLRLPRPPHRACAVQARLPHPRRGAASRSRLPSPAARAGRPDPRRAGERALPGFGRRRRRRARTSSSTWSASCSSAAGRASRRCRRKVAGVIAAAAAAAGARMIHMSAIGADPEFASRSMPGPRRSASRRCWAAQPAATIFRPSIVFGPEDAFFNKFAAMARLLAGAAADRRRRIPGSSRCSSATSPKRSPGRSTARRAPGTIYELGGPDVQDVQGADGIRAGDHRAPPAADAAAVRARRADGARPAIPADTAADAGSGATCSRRTTWCRRRPCRTVARSRASASSRTRWRSSCRPICGVSARAASSVRGRSERRAAGEHGGGPQPRVIRTSRARTRRYCAACMRAHT